MAAMKLVQLYHDEESEDGLPNPALYRRPLRWIKGLVFPTSPKPVWPSVRSGHRCAANETHLFVYGGYDPVKTYGELWALNLTTKEWEIVSSECPPFSASSAVLLVRDHLFVFGGSGYPFGTSNSDDFRSYSLRAKKWINLGSISSGKLPTARYGSGIAIDSGEQLYLHSGTEGSMFLDDLYCFDTRALEWREIVQDKKLCPGPSPRYRHEVVYQKDKFYVFGGGTLTQSFGFEHIDTFDFSSMSWSKIPTYPCTRHGFPAPRVAHSCVIFRDTVYMACGMIFVINYRDSFDDLWKLDLKTMKWEKLDIVFPYKMHFHAAAVTPGGCMYVFGGVRKGESDAGMSSWKRTSDLFQIWLDVPPLLELAWTVLFDKIWNEHQTLKTLYDIGVPNNLIARLQGVSPQCK